MVEMMMRLATSFGFLAAGLSSNVIMAIPAVSNGALKVVRTSVDSRRQVHSGLQPGRVPVSDILQRIYQSFVHPESDLTYDGNRSDRRCRQGVHNRQGLAWCADSRRECRKWDFDFDTVQEGEWIKAVEFGYAPLFEERNAHRIQFTYWEKDARTLAGVSKGSGWAVSAAHRLNDRWFPFVRFGHSDGGGGVAAEDAVSVGVEFTQRFDQTWTIGAGWARPSQETFGPGLDNEKVLETSYKFQLSKNFSLMPDVQLVFDPANNPDESSIWVIGIRAMFVL